MGIEIAAALWRLYPGSFRLDKTFAIIESRQVLDAIRAGQDPVAIAASWQDALEAFRKLRAGHLLY
jgi:DNA-binding GntR family transcriptional regulator